MTTNLEPQPYFFIILYSQRVKTKETGKGWLLLLTLTCVSLVDATENPSFTKDIHNASSFGMLITIKGMFPTEIRKESYFTTRVMLLAKLLLL